MSQQLNVLRHRTAGGTNPVPLAVVGMKRRKDGQMTYERHRQINRRVILSSLLIWLAIQLTQAFEPLGSVAALTEPLMIIGLTALPVLVLWPWLKGRFLWKGVDTEQDQRRALEPHQILVSLEILALSGMLFFLLAHL
jgi:hypothetical protein